MYKLIWSILFFTISFVVSGQLNYKYEPSPTHPYGLPNPEAPSQIIDFAPLIGTSECKSTARNNNQEWAEPIDMLWRWKYIMNGKGVQDETLKSDGGHSGSIRQYITDSSRWFVHYYSSSRPSTSLPSWEGSKTVDGKIILYRDQIAPNGMEGFYRLTFYDISEDGYKWIGEWVDKAESITFPTWKIDCKKTSYATNDMEKAKILSNIKAFSQAYMNGDTEAIANSYTSDGKIFPNNTNIISGTADIQKRWTITNGTKILNHEIHPTEIKFLGDYAYDYGTYKGKSQLPDNSISEWKGKYVIVWQKVDGDWKMYLDIWNNIAAN